MWWLVVERTADWTLGRLFRPLMSNLHCYFDDFGLLSMGFDSPLSNLLFNFSLFGLWHNNSALWCPISSATLHLLDLGAINLLPEVQSSPKFFTDWTLPQQFRLLKSNPPRNSSSFGPWCSNSACRSPIWTRILRTASPQHAHQMPSPKQSGTAIQPL